MLANQLYLLMGLHPHGGDIEKSPAEGQCCFACAVHAVCSINAQLISHFSVPSRDMVSEVYVTPTSKFIVF